MAKKRKKKHLIPRSLLIICVITGIATLILRMLNRKLAIPEIGEISGYTGTAFAVSLLIIVGIWLVNVINKK